MQAKQIIVDFEFYQGGVVTSWIQTSFDIEQTEYEPEEEQNPPTLYDMLSEWVGENYPDSGIARITNIWKV
jgi:hypothetical protein